MNFVKLFRYLGHNVYMCIFPKKIYSFIFWIYNVVKDKVIDVQICIKMWADDFSHVVPFIKLYWVFNEYRAVHCE